MASPRPPTGLGPKFIEIIIDEEGNAIVEAHGFNGQGCRVATRDLEAKLGKVTSRHVKTGGAGGVQQKIGR